MTLPLLECVRLGVVTPELSRIITNCAAMPGVLLSRDCFDVDCGGLKYFYPFSFFVRV